MAKSHDWALDAPPLKAPISLPLTLEMVESVRESREYFLREKGHQILMDSWESMMKMLPKVQDGVVSIDITQSHSWPKVIAGASDTVRRKLVGSGIIACHLEMKDSCKNAWTGKPQPFFVLTHSDGWQALYHPKKQKDGLLAFRESDLRGQLHFDHADHNKDDRRLAFELATNWGQKSIQSKIQEFQKFRRPTGWQTDDFEIGLNVSWIRRVLPDRGMVWKLDWRSKMLFWVSPAMYWGSVLWIWIRFLLVILGCC